jgi:predicted permease
VLLFASACAVVIGVVFGLVPALAMLGRGSGSRVRIGTGQTAGGAALAQRALIAAEVALSLVMLVGCSLLGRSLVRLTSVNPGFVSDGLFEIATYSTAGFWRDDARIDRFNAAATEALRAIPGITATSGASGGLFEGSGSSSPIKVVGVDYTDGGPMIQQRVVLPGYLHTIGAPLLAGRDFTAADQSGSEPVVIVTQAAVQRDFDGRSPIGKEVLWQGKTWTVIGIAGDVRYRDLSANVDPMIYIPSAQQPGNTVVFTVRASADQQSLARLIKERIDAIDPAVTVTRVDPVASLIQHSYGEERYRTLLGSLFGILAAILAGIGMFGVISRTVAQRLREVGIRVALGAQERSVVALMLRDTIRGAAIGVVAGTLLAALLARGLAPYLFGVRAGDPVAYLVAFALLAITMIAATLPPARRAARVDPVTILRAE